MIPSFILPEDDESIKRGPPIGVRVIRRLMGKDAGLNTHRYSVLFMTFVAYACYHAARKPFSIVKSVLDDVDYDNSAAGLNRSHVALHPLLPVNHFVSRHHNTNRSYQDHWHYDRVHGTSFQTVNGSEPPLHPGALGGWAPFNDKGGKGLLGDVDLAFLGSYAIGMYFAGQLGDRLDLRYFLTMGMTGSAFFVCLFGFGYWFNIHSICYFLGVQVAAGLFQSTGWPSVVSIVGKWFGKRQRGLIMGVWNAHTSVGNILGSLLAAAGLQYGWGWSFLLPGLLQAAGGLLMFFFLVVEPADVGLVTHEDGVKHSSQLEAHRNADLNEFSEKLDEEAGLVKESELSLTASAPQVVNGTERTVTGGEETGLLRRPDEDDEPDEPIHHGAVGFVQAWNIPGVAPFAFCLFFAKLVAYTFLNWLPFYITQTKIAGEYLDEKTAGYLSTLFDVGGVVGGILAGHLSDRLNARAITAAGFMYAAIPALLLYRDYGGMSLTMNVALMMIAGMLVNGPYALITTAVSADLGTHTSLKGNPRALATVTAIIDGTGSVGAAIGPLLTGYISEISWDYVFWFLMVSALLAGLLLTRLVIGEVIDKIQKARFEKETAGLQVDGVGGSLTQRLLNGRH